MSFLRRISVAYVFKAFMLPVLVVFPSLETDQCFRKRVFLLVAKGDRLTTNVISSHNAASLMDCGQQCLQQMICVAFNYRSTRKSNEPNCQLTNSTEGYDESDTKNNTGDWRFHRALDAPSSPCLKNPCKNGGECVPNVCQPESFSCKCGLKYKGKLCEVEEVFTSCEEAFNISSIVQDDVYKIKTETTNRFTKVYCQMTSLPGCSGGGWTMVMKINGTKETFEYSSPYWTDRQSYNLAGGLSGFDDNETKLPTYWSTSFNELCVGMKVGADLNFVSISYPARSLSSLFADGIYRETHIGRLKWKTLISGSSLQYRCNKQGFNLASHISIRLGFMANNENDCSSIDSFIGLGVTKFTHVICGKTPSLNTAGNLALCNPDNGDKNTKSMSFILVR